ncbi:hypothetical protein [Halobellus clavatus]|uniref:Uncharacterized protein n=1 Tax=Halobellus clavatus TaxID=660517 RepID=A0A1H3IA76_9EURY|nr:hypothetical protein [Halobellus clavatus]SDY24098.1 hypothetical protein SAMN04487946_10964 [Halobellus clavatus]
MRAAEVVGEPTTDGGANASWRWATVLAVQPVLTIGACLGALLFGLLSTATRAFGLPAYLPIFPGALTLVFLGVAYVYTPIYAAGVVLDRRSVRASAAVWSPSRLVLLGSGIQAIYFVVPMVQAYGGETFEELVFGSVELAALLSTGILTVQYLAVRDSNLPGTPALVSLWSSVWSRVTTFL